MNIYKQILLLSLLWLNSIVVKGQHDIFLKTDACLKTYVREGKVDYKRLKINSASFDSLILEYQEFDLKGRSNAFRKAFYINAYNLMVIHGILKAYPVGSPKAIVGCFDQIKVKVAQEYLTLDQLEFERLFSSQADPRLHFALNCAAMSCPTLFSEAFMPDKVDEQLDFCQTMVMDRDDYVFVDRKERVVKVSKIFEWYGEMFEEASGSLRQYINENRFVTIPRNYEIVFMEYDWRLNELKD